jgi:hypothetical protein
MSRLARYHPDGRILDLTALAAGDYQLLASLAGQIGRGDNILECLTPGGDPWLLVYRHGTGVYYARHFPGGAHTGHHRLIRKSDEHLRAQEYSERGYAQPAAQEVTTNNHTRLDVATLDAPVMTALEVQLSPATIASVKARTTRSTHATAFTGRHARPVPGGVTPVWLAANDRKTAWLYHVPTLTTTAGWDAVPPRNTVGAIGVRRIVAEKCTPGSRWQACPRTGHGVCHGTHPYAEAVTGVTLDQVLTQTATGQLVPLRYFTGAVYLTDPPSAALYAELGGDGTYTASDAAKPRSTLLGPCKATRHDPPPPAAPTPTAGRTCSLPGCDQPRTQYRIYTLCDQHLREYWQEDSRQRRAEAERRREQERALRDYDQRIRRMIAAKRERQTWCGVPGCHTRGRPYMNGTRCDQHKP